jgi:DNA-binding response OmpR family regulator
MNRTIVLADTDLILLEILRTRCRAMGLFVQTAHRGDDAVKLIRRTGPHLACVQHDMPCSDGRTVCESLADDPQSWATTLILTCDRPGDTLDGACRELGAYVTPRSGNIWHRLEPLIHELVEDLGQENPDCCISADGIGGGAIRATGQESRPERATTPQPSRELRIDEPAGPQLRTSDPGLASVAGSAPVSPPRRDARESVLDAVFAWFGHTKEPAAGESSPSRLSGPHRRNSTEPPWVLCIEDDSDFSLALKLRLEAHGIAVVRAFDGRAGYRAAFTHPASAILLDYNLPLGQGDYVLRRLKENPVTADVPVIVLTGIRSAATRRQMLALGADAYLTKPLDFDELVDALAEHVEVLPREFAAASY